MSRRRKSLVETERTADTVPIGLTAGELDTVCAALDSHIYWELSDKAYRDSGYVQAPGSDDDKTAAEIVEAESLRVWIPV